MRRRSDFTAAVRSGRRAGRRNLVAHLLIREECAPPLVGFIVGKPVGNAVVRNTVKRRLRHIVAKRLDGLPQGSLLVIRANPAAADSKAVGLAEDVDVALARLLRQVGA